jgi:hypothetical protein
LQLHAKLFIYYADAQLTLGFYLRLPVMLKSLIASLLSAIGQLKMLQTFHKILNQSISARGLLEHQLISCALQHWQLAEKDNKIIKLTAKYSVENLDEVLLFASQSEYPLYGWIHPGKRMIDSRCFLFRSQAYKDFSIFMDRIDDRQAYYMEHAIYDILSHLRIRPGLLRFRPLVHGLSGSSGVVIRIAAWKRFLVYCASLPLHTYR